MSARGKSGGAGRARSFAAGMARAGAQLPDDQGPDREEMPPRERPVVGNWARSAVTQIRQDLDALREQQAQAVIDGSLPIVIPIDRIEDVVGSDRLSQEGEQSPDGETDPSDIASLADNIRRRGLRVPIRVRPMDSDWRPSPSNPGDIGDMRFTLQSGRRRLAACRMLGVNPLACLSFSEADDARRDDLEERFFENVARRDLTVAERLLSVGLIAEEYPGLPAEQVASLLGVGKATYYRGRSLLEHKDAVEAMLDLKTATQAEIDAAVAQVRAKPAAQTPEARRKRAARAAARPSVQTPFERRTFAGTELRFKAGRSGKVVMSMETTALDEQALTRIAAFIEEVASSTEKS